MIRRALPAGLLALAAGTGCFAHRYRENPRIATVEGDPIVAMEPSDTFPSVDHPLMVRLPQHTARPDEDDRVLGIDIASPSRAYPIGLLDRFEVVNDGSGGVPFVVVRCALTDVAAAWDRRVDGRTLAFESTGALWRDTLVMRDRSTRTYWSAATGRALSGPLTGQRLQGIPAVVTRGDRWEEVHPDSVYLDMRAETSSPILMKIYRVSPWQGVSGARTVDRRHKPKERVLALEAGGEVLAFTSSEAEARAPFDARVGGERFRVEWDSALAAPRAFGPDGAERPVLSMFWFAVDRHFAPVRTLEEPAPAGGAPGGRRKP